MLLFWKKDIKSKYNLECTNFRELSGGCKKLKGQVSGAVDEDKFL